MHRTFELLVFSGANATAGTVAASDHVTASGAGQGAKSDEKLVALKALAGSLNLKVHGEGALVAAEPGSMCDVVAPIESIGRQSIVLIAGAPDAAQLSNACDVLKTHGNDIIIVVDALANLASLLGTLEKLNEKAVQMAVVGALKMLITGQHLMVYRFPKADSTTTTAVFADIDAEDPLVLTMVRGQNPFKGKESFPGGFLNVHLESLAECAAREVMEECFVNDKATGEDDRFTYHVKAGDMVLIDVRSDPDRDERGHVVDHGYAWFIPKDQQAEVMEKLNAGDDAQAGSARFVRVSELMKVDLAFDHKTLFLAALARLKEMKKK